MADKEITPKDPQATEAEAKDDERDEADRKSQAAKWRGRMSGRKTQGFRYSDASIKHDVARLR